MRKITIRASKLTAGFLILSDYHEGIIADERQIPGAKWDPGLRGWTAPATRLAAESLQAFAQKWRFEVSPEATALLTRLIPPVPQLRPLDGLGITLRPFQIEGVTYMIDKRRVLLGDQMGLGKSCEALAALYVAQAFPALIIAPASLTLNWAREARRAIPNVSIELLAPGWTVPPTLNNTLIIASYEQLYVRKEDPPGPEPDTTRKKSVAVTPALLQLKPTLQAVVVDEFHYVKNAKAKRTLAVKQLTDTAPYLFGLSGSPVLNKPAELLSPLTILGRLQAFGGWRRFVERYCGAEETRFGWDISGATNLKDLNQQLRRTCYIRRLKTDVAKDLPAKTRTTVPVNINNRALYNTVRDDVARWMADQAIRDEAFLESLTAMDPDDAALAEVEERLRVYERTQAAEALVRITQLRRVAALGKIDAAEEWIRTFLDSGEKLIVFAHHKEIQTQIATRFPDCAVVRGDDPVRVRQQHVDRFQTSPTPLIVCSLIAGGVGITLTAASNVAFLEYGWSPATQDQAEDRAHRIGQVNTVNIWNLVAVDTIEEDILDLIEKKRTIVDAATDGIVTKTGPSILTDLTRRLIALA